VLGEDGLEEPSLRELARVIKAGLCIEACFKTRLPLQSKALEAI
jgi:hypothetical protein